MNNKVMIIGAVRAGKSTLTKALLNEPLDATKTQTLQYEDWIIDTPGEYLENPMFYKSIIATSLEVSHVIYLQDATRNHSNFPPYFASGISKLPIGVITKCDLQGADLQQAKEWLRLVVGHAPIVVTSAMKHIGIDHIKQLVICNTFDEMKDYVEQANDPLLFLS